jgi:DNA polymerase-1
VSLANVKLHLVDSIDDVLALSSWLGERRPTHALAFDTETTGLVIGKDRVRLVQVGDGEHGWAIPWEMWGGLFKDIVRKWDGVWIAHNEKFDVGMLDHMGVSMPRARVRDTRVMHHILYPHYSSALKPIASRLVDAQAASLQTDLKGSGWDWETVPIDYQPYWSYAALDTVLTWKVDEILFPEVMANAPIAFQIESAVTWIIERMERYGAHINLPFAQRKLTEFNEYVDIAGKWVEDTYGVKAGSNAAIVKVLQGEGYEFTKATATGAVALDKEVLGGIDHPLAQTVLQRRQLQKLASTYLTHFVSETDEDDCIHPSINTLGARTSRMSMERPNLQNLPRKNERNTAAEAIRSCVTARDGNVMLMCDFDQVEMRMMAHMAQEHTMIDAFRGDTDFFVALARMVYGDDSIVKSDPRRQVVKNAGYATIYGAGVEKFSKTAGITYEQGQWVRQRWNALYPAVLAFQNTVQNVAVERRVREGLPYVLCPVTRRRQVAEPGKEYALVNFLIQGAAAAVLKMKLIELDSAGLGEWMVVPVHDEIILDVPAEHFEDAADTLRRVMNDDQMFSVPLSASVSYGMSWGSKESYDHRS